MQHSEPKELCLAVAAFSSENIGRPFKAGILVAKARAVVGYSYGLLVDVGHIADGRNLIQQIARFPAQQGRMLHGTQHIYHQKVFLTVHRFILSSFTVHPRHYPRQCLRRPYDSPVRQGDNLPV